jgi:hypothetical protein
MTGKELKELISVIPDDKTIVFEYSCFTFSDIGMITTKKSEMRANLGMNKEDFKMEFPGKNYCMISFDN